MTNERDREYIRQVLRERQDFADEARQLRAYLAEACSAVNQLSETANIALPRGFADWKRASEPAKAERSPRE